MGETTEIVNAGVTVLHLLANSAGNHVDQGSYASGMPSGVSADGLAGWQYQRITKQWKQTSEWYEFWEVDWDFTLGMNFNYDGTLHGVGKYVDQITMTLDVAHIPPDFTLDVTAHFPQHGINVGTDDAPIGALRFTCSIEAKGFLGQLVSWTQTLNCLARGDGQWEMG